MKRSSNYLCLIIMTMIAFAGCAKEVVETVPKATSVQFFTKSIETKTTFGELEGDKYPTYWSDNDQIKILLNLESIAGTEKTVTITPSNDKSTASFSADITDPKPETGGYTFYSVSPASAYVGKSVNEGRFTINIPSDQTPLDNSVDEKAQVLYAVSSTTNAMPSEVELVYQHFAAYGKISFSNLPEDIEISSIVLESNDVNLAGQWKYNINNQTIDAGKTPLNKITITTTKKSDVWFACAPVNVAGKTVSFTIITNNGDIKKNVTFRDGAEFKSGVVTSFTINMEGYEPEVEEVIGSFEKVTSEPDDWSGTYLFVYEDGNVAFDGSLTTLDVASNTVEVDISDSSIPAKQSLLESAFTIAKSDESYYSVKSASGFFIGQTSYSNGLSSSDETPYSNSIKLDDNNSTVSISCSTSSGYVFLKFNSASNQNRFRYYKSDQQSISLYKYVESE